MSLDKLDYRTDYEVVDTGQTDQVIGKGIKGDILDRIIVTVGASGATGIVNIKDGSSGSNVLVVAANTPIGVYTINLGARSVATGGWRISTGAGARCIAVGRFQ